MKVCAIIAEYNPLHNGHVYHIQKTREQIQPDFLIVVMSGHFTQRGEPAIIDKWSRAEWALRAGADMVIELPTVYATGSASRFAQGALDLIKGLGVVTHLSFGSETEDLQQLQQVVDLRSSGQLDQHLFSYLKDGLTYAKAFESAIAKLAPEMNLSFFSQSNAILAMEYLYYLKGSGITPVLIRRSNSTSHGALKLVSPITSATAIRHALTVTRQDISATIPGFVSIPYPVTLHSLDLPIRVALQALGVQGIERLQDVGEGLENRIYSCLQQVRSLPDLLEKVKSKRYLYTRLQRIMVYALLGLDKQVATPENGVYARILAQKKSAGALSIALKESATIPVFTKVAGFEHFLKPHLHPLLQKDILATNIYSTVSPLPGNSDYTHPLVVL